MHEEQLYTRSTRRALTRAHELALEHGVARVGVEHLMLAVLEDDESVAAAAIANVASLREVTAELTRMLDAERPDIVSGVQPVTRRSS